MGGVISVTAISWHIFICLFLAGTSWVGNVWALICRALEGARRVTAGSPGRGLSGVGHGARPLREGTALPWLCTLPWKQSRIVNRDACGCEPTVCWPFGLTSCCPSASVVVTVLCQVGGRGAGVAGDCGLSLQEKGPRREVKVVPCVLGLENTSAEVLGAKGVWGAGSKGKFAGAAVVGTTARYRGA